MPPAHRPTDHFPRLGGWRTEFLRRRDHAHPAQVQAVGIPARLDRDVGLGLAVRVTGAGFVKKIELLVGKNEPLITKGQGEVSTPLSVAAIGAFIHTTGIVEDGEELHDFDVGLGFPASRMPFSKTLAQWPTP